MATLAEERAALVAALGMPADDARYSVPQLRYLSALSLEDRQLSPLFDDNGKLNPNGPANVADIAGLGGIVPTEARVLTSETTTSPTYTDLTTVGPAVTVTIGSSGKALVILTASIKNTAGGAANYAIAGLAISGATTRAPADDDAIYKQGLDEAVLSRTLVVTGLTSGSTTFTMKYLGATGGFQRRSLIVIPL